MFSKFIFSAALVLASQPALAEGRYGFRCSIVESATITFLPGGKDQFLNPSPNPRVFVIDPSQMTYRERFLGSDGPATPFTIEHLPQGNSLVLDEAKALNVWISGEFNGVYKGYWIEENPKGWNPGVKIIHTPEGTCQEVADIPDVDLPAKSYVDRAKRSLNELIGGK